MSYLESFHAEHKARLARIASRAYSPPSHERRAQIEPRKPVKRRGAFYKPTLSDERAWSVEICGSDAVNAIREAPRVEQIQRAVCEHFGITRLDMISARRTADVVRPRQVAAYLCRRLTKHSLPEIGRRFGGRDHTTQLWAIRQVTLKMEADEHLRASVDMLTDLLGGEPA